MRRSIPEIRAYKRRAGADERTLRPMHPRVGLIRRLICYWSRPVGHVFSSELEHGSTGYRCACCRAFIYSD